MMKQILYSILLTVSCHFVSAQSDSTKRSYHFGVAVNSSYSFSTGLTHASLLTYSNNRHQLEFGPRVSFENSGYYTNRLGMEFSYTFFPNTRKKPFSAFLMFNTGFLNKTLEREYLQSFGAPSQTYTVQQKSTRKYYEFHIGYGIQFRPFSQLYISTNVGVGITLEDYNDNRVSSIPELTSYKGYMTEQLNFRSALTIGYVF